MKVVVLGAGGGLGQSVIAAAIEAGHDVHALLRRPPSAPFSDGVTLHVADASALESLAPELKGMDVAFACVNPPFSRWSELFPPLLASIVGACSQTRTRLVFPANVWVYGSALTGQSVSEGTERAPTSRLGRLRSDLEDMIVGSEVASCIVRLPEFYGPFVVSLTARVFRAALRGRRAIWPGPVNREAEFIYMPDAGRAILSAGCAANAEGETFHVPGTRVSVRHFIGEIYRQCGSAPRILAVSPWLLHAAGVFDATIRGAADISHVWTHPVLLDGTKYEQRIGTIPRTPLRDGIAATLDWHRANPTLQMQG